MVHAAGPLRDRSVTALPLKSKFRLSAPVHVPSRTIITSPSATASSPACIVAKWSGTYEVAPTAVPPTTRTQPRTNAQTLWISLLMSMPPTLSCGPASAEDRRRFPAQRRSCDSLATVSHDSSFPMLTGLLQIREYVRVIKNNTTSGTGMPTIPGMAIPQ